MAVRGDLDAIAKAAPPVRNEGQAVFGTADHRSAHEGTSFVSASMATQVHASHALSVPISPARQFFFASH